MIVPLLINTINEQINKITLEQPTFFEFGKIFDIVVDPRFDHNPYNTFLQKLKVQIFQVFNKEGPNYFRNFIKSPMVQQAIPQTKMKLKQLFDNIWFQYSRKITIQNQNRYKMLQKLIPDFKRLQEIQNFHLQLLSSFKSSRLCKQNSQQNKQNLYMPNSPFIETQFKRPRDPISQMMDSQSKYMGMIPNNNGMMPFPKVEDDPKYGNPMWPDQKFMSHPSNFPIHQPVQQYNRSFNNHQWRNQNQFERQNRQKSQQAIQKNHALANDYQVSEQDEKSQQNKMHITGSQGEFQSKLQTYLFSECACEGELKDSSAYMVCKQCQFYFHNSCLYIDQNSTIDMCPCCKLKEGSNIFVRIYPEPFGKRWCQNLKNKKLTLFLTEHQIQNMRKEKLNCKPSSNLEYQLRFLRINRKKKQENGKVTSQSSRKFNNLPLPSLYIQKIKPYNQFQISLKQTDQNEGEECSYFFAIFMVQKFSQVALTEQLFSSLNDQNSVGEQFIQQFLNGQQSITIKMKDPTSQRKILYPVRGNKCQHPEVFDYMSILEYYKEYGEKLKDKHCSICDTPIDKMIVDRFIWQKIKQFEKDNQDKQIELLKYFGEGRVEYIEEQEQNQEPQSSSSNSEISEQNGQEESESLSC